MIRKMMNAVQRDKGRTHQSQFWSLFCCLQPYSVSSYIGMCGDLPAFIYWNSLDFTKILCPLEISSFGQIGHFNFLFGKYGQHIHMTNNLMRKLGLDRLGNHISGAHKVEAAGSRSSTRATASRQWKPQPHRKWFIWVFTMLLNSFSQRQKKDPNWIIL